MLRPVPDPLPRCARSLYFRDGKSDEDGRWTRRLALLYPDRIDWGYVRVRTSTVPEEAEALSRVEREARPR